jgi:hypothetical protein
MKKITWILAVLISLPAAAVLARDGQSGGGGDRGGGGGWSGGGGNQGDGGSSAGSWDSSDHTSNNHARAYSNSVRSNGVGARSWGNSYYRNGRNGFGYGQVRHYNRSYGSNSYNSHSWNNGNFNHTTTALHHFNTSSGASSSFNHSLNAPRPLSQASLLPHSLQHSQVQVPSRGPSGKAFSASLISPNRMNSSVVRNQMASISHNSQFSAKVALFNRSETLRNHYYWHQFGGWNYCHFNDGFGCNWYGWGWGGSFFWTQWYGDNWWWYDPWGARWCYWGYNGWYWQDPSSTTVYIYENGDYTPADQANADGNGYNQPSNGNEGGSYSAGEGNNQQPGGNVMGAPNDEENPNVPKDVVEFPSPDKSRTVKVIGESGDAFLYDVKNSFKPLFLESDVKNVKFSTDKKGALRIELILSDGSYEKFDAQGQQLKDADDTPKPVGTKAERPGGPEVDME